MPCFFAQASAEASLTWRCKELNERIQVAFLVTVLSVVLVIEGVPWFLFPAGYKTLLRQISCYLTSISVWPVLRP